VRSFFCKLSKQACPDAVFFTTIGKLDDDDSHTADEDEVSTFFPMLTSLGNLTPSVDSTVSDEQRYEAYRNACTVSKILERLEIETKLQKDSFLWHMHRKSRITGTVVHDVLRRRESTEPANLVSTIMRYSERDLSYTAAVSWGLEKPNT